MTTATLTALPEFSAAYQGLLGMKSTPLDRITDGTLVRVTATIVSARTSGGAIWLGLRTDDGATGVARMDLALSAAIPGDLYDLGQRVELRGVARTLFGLPQPHIAVRAVVRVEDAR
ncbi:hypothetical protein ACEZDB_35950 [Streptacidiphilus sp. N1-3]|uniref:OB-fold nucleic acid binding domain-containing protein n=1 Tax=Streptacidiphilus alkalitolerans TaxID=3342712 RepID=A0ABV6XCR1_9ACTN